MDVSAATKTIGNARNEWGHGCHAPSDKPVARPVFQGW